jgi:hypothetical protein
MDKVFKGYVDKNNSRSNENRITQPTKPDNHHFILVFFMILAFFGMLLCIRKYRKSKITQSNNDSIASAEYVNHKNSYVAPTLVTE